MLLRAAGISKHFDGVVALDSVRLELEKGEVLGIMGGNGSGKSTLLNVLCGALAPDSGTLELEGEDVLSLPPDKVARRGVVRVWQALKFVDEMTPWDHAALGLLSRGRRGPLQKDEAQLLSEALSGLSVWKKRHDAFRRLSYFEKREADYARCVVSRPKLLLVDELTSGLTTAERALFEGRMLKLKDSGVAMLIVEHHPEFLRRTADNIMLLEAGLVSYYGPVIEFFEEPRC